MEDLLPFLFALGILGFQLYSRNKKKQAQRLKQAQQQTQQQTQQQPPQIPEEEQEEFSPGIDDFIGQFFGGQKDQFEETQMDEATVVENEKKSWMEQMHQKQPESIEYMDTDDNIHHKKTQFEMIQNKPSKVTEKLDFDLRKAIIYDAIMNPPYIESPK